MTNIGGAGVPPVTGPGAADIVDLRLDPTGEAPPRAVVASGGEPATEPIAGAVVAAFDLDGTLTRGHSIPEFATRLGGRAALGLAAVRGLAGVGLPPRRSAYKDAVLGRVFAGRSGDDVRAAGRRFASELVDARLVVEAAAQLRAHQAVGHRVVLVTAALDVYAEPLADLLGIDGVIATVVEIEDGRCTGRLLDSDLHDERKVERLKRWLGADEPSTTVFAYGNSEDDEEMIRYASSTAVRRRRPVRADQR